MTNQNSNPNESLITMEDVAKEYHIRYVKANEPTKSFEEDDSRYQKSYLFFTNNGSEFQIYFDQVESKIEDFIKSIKSLLEKSSRTRPQ